VESDRALWTTSQTAPGSYSWTDWSYLGGSIAGVPSAARNADGRIEVFVRGTDNALYHIWQTSPGGAWSGYGELGGFLDNSPVSVLDAFNQLQAFVGGSDSSLWYIGQSSAGVWF
jgi:hypothetical protein